MKRLITTLIIGFLAAILFIGCADQKSGKKTASAQDNLTENVVKAQGDENSIYQLTGEWQNQNSEEMTLPDLKGKIQLTAMIFTSCGYACPKMVSNMKAIEQALPKDLKDQVGFVLFTFDTKVDTPERLNQYAQSKELDASWTLLHGTPEETRTVSMLLNTQYDRLSNGMFSHSNILTVLDRQGNVYRQFKGLDIKSKNVIASIEQLASL